MGYQQKLVFILLAAILVSPYVVAADYNDPEAKSDIIKIGVMLLYALGLGNLFGLKPLWNFLSKKGTFVGKMEFADFVRRVANILAFLLILFFAITGMFASDWLVITFNGKDINLEAFVAFGVVLRLFVYDRG